MWHKAIWKVHPMKLELTGVGLLAELANHYTTRGAFYICNDDYKTLHRCNFIYYIYMKKIQKQSNPKVMDLL